MLNPITNTITSSNPSEGIKAAHDKVPTPQYLSDTKATIASKAISTSLMEKIHPITEKIKEVALLILAVAVSAFLFWVNPSIFAIGFISGIIFDDQVKNAIQKIKNIWMNQKLTGCILGTIACFLSLPVTLATASFLWSAHLGTSWIDQNLQTKQEGHPSADGTTQKSPATGFC